MHAIVNQTSMCISVGFSVTTVIYYMLQLAFYLVAAIHRCYGLTSLTCDPSVAVLETVVVVSIESAVEVFSLGSSSVVMASEATSVERENQVLT